MQSMTTYDALILPADSRHPHIVPLMTSAPNSSMDDHTEPYRCARVPHPELYMDYVAESVGARAWRYQVIEALEGMNKKFHSPYIIFYPAVSRDGMPFPINRWIRELQADRFDARVAWCGDLVLAKYRDSQYSAMEDISMADFPIIKNYLSTHPPLSGTAGWPCHELGPVSRQTDMRVKP